MARLQLPEPTATVEDLTYDRIEDGTTVTVYGVANQHQRKTTKQDNPWMQFELSGMRRRIRVLLFPRPFIEFGEIAAPRRVPGERGSGLLLPLLAVTGRVDTDRCEPEMIATSVTRLPLPDTHQYGDPMGPLLAAALPERLRDGACTACGAGQRPTTVTAGKD